MIRTILVPLDGSTAAETVLPYVKLIASPIGADVHLLTIAANEEEQSEATAYLTEKSKELSAHSLTAAVAPGDEARTILEQADAKDADLIAMSTHGRSGLMRWILGSTADKVVHRSTRPVLLVRAQEEDERPPAKVERVLVPLDGSDLAESVLPYVEEMAAALDAEIVLYNAVLPLDIYPAAESTPAPAGNLIDDLVEQGKSFLAKVGREIESRGKAKVQMVVTVGFPVDEITRVARETNVGLIAMATHGRSGVDRWVMGSVADGVVRRSSLPCLLVRPDGLPQMAG